MVAITAIQMKTTAGSSSDGIRLRKDDQQNHAVLRECLAFAELRRADHHALAGGDRAQPGDQEFARGDDDNDPRRKQRLRGEDHQDGDDHELVRERIEELAELGHEVAAAGDPSVERVGRGGGDVGDGADLVVVGEIDRQEGADHRDQEDAQDRQLVRDRQVAGHRFSVHTAISRRVSGVSQELHLESRR